MKNKKKSLPEWERLVSAEAVFQSRFPESVLVGGTACALHIGHRVSLDADYVLTDLHKRFAEVLAKVEQESGWHTKRLQPPVLILGNFEGVRTGIRQLVRHQPLETMVIRGFKVPTLAEMLRIKAYLIVKRNTTRDYVDFIAMYDHLGVTESLRALDSLDTLYPQDDPDISVTQQLAIQLSEPKPWDLSETDLRKYKRLQAPYTDWQEVAHRLCLSAQKIIQRRLEIGSSRARCE